MVNIQTLISDLEMEKELLRCIKRREIEQKYIYLGTNAHSYYTAKFTGEFAPSEYWENWLTQEQRISFIGNLINPEAKKVAFISLGCGNAKIELALMKSLSHKNVLFFGVDTSKEMLQIAQEAFKKEEVKGQFLCADFSSGELRTEIKNIEEREQIDQTIFLFIGNTLANVPQTEIVDTLYNFLEEKDTLYLDVLTRTSLEKTDDLKIFNAYTNMLRNTDRINMYSNSLIQVGIPRENMKPTLKTYSEDSIGVLCFTFSMEIIEPTTISYRGEKIHLLPPEEIKFLEIRTYHPETFISFYHKHGLDLIHQEISGHQGQFAFKKNI